MFPLVGAKLCTDHICVLSRSHPSFHVFFLSPSLPTSQHPVLGHSSVCGVSDTFLLLAVRFFLLEAFSGLHPSACLPCAPRPLSPWHPCCLLSLCPACSPEVLFFFPHDFNSALHFLRNGPLLVHSAGTRPPPFFTSEMCCAF